MPRRRHGKTLKKADLSGDPAITLSRTWLDNKWILARHWRPTVEHQKGRFEHVEFKSAAAAYHLFYRWVEEKADP